MKARVIAGVLIALSAALYAARLDTAAGLYVDDAWYVVLAKAIAQGDADMAIAGGLCGPPARDAFRCGQCRIDLAG